MENLIFIFGKSGNVGLGLTRSGRGGGGAGTSRTIFGRGLAGDGTETEAGLLTSASLGHIEAVVVV